MTSFFIILFSVIVILGIIPLADAHTAKIVGDFKINVGWETEPPIRDIDNVIVITVSIADESEKLLYDMIFFNKIDDSDDETTEQHLLGLTETLESYVSIGSSKTMLMLEEETEQFGMYRAKYTPTEIGVPSVHLSGVIKNIEFELTSKIEKIEDDFDMHKIPEWIKNNAKWWSDGTIGDEDFISGIGYMIQNDIMKISNLPEQTETSIIDHVPEWIKNNAKWWSEGNISDDDFVKGIKYLVEKRIVHID